MNVEGVDYSFTRPDPQAMHDRGVRFAVRYVGTPHSGKNLTRSEVDDLQAAGIDLVACYETTPGFMVSGAGTGAIAAYEAWADALDLGMPAVRPIYFALDIDPRSLDENQWTRVEQFLAGAAYSIGHEHVGVYGGHEAIHRLVPNFAAYGWQTYAWSAGRWSPEAALQQYRNGVSMGGGVVDLCRAVKPDFGQWGYESDSISDNEKEIDQMLIRNMTTGAVLHLVGNGSVLVEDRAQLASLQGAGLKMASVSATQFARYARNRVDLPTSEAFDLRSATFDQVDLPSCDEPM